MTFYELLRKYSIEELWYILSMRHNLHGKPIKAECLFKLYQSAYNELLSLHSPDNTAENILICELADVGKNNKNIATDSYINCYMLSPNEDGSGEMSKYAISFITWLELIDCHVSEESLAKYGGLLCTAELLLKITFYGYTAKQTENAVKKLQEIAADAVKNPDKRTKLNLNIFRKDPEETAAEESAITQWLLNAPELVKQLILGHIASDVVSRDEVVDDISVDEVLKRMNYAIESSSCKRSDICGMLHSMLRGLDEDERVLLLQKLNY